MNNKERENLYRMDELFDKVDLGSIFSFHVDLTRSYNYNKKHLENQFREVFGNNIISGVWIIEDIDDKVKKTEIVEVYEVCSSSNILAEMLRGLQFLYLGKRDARKDIYKNFTRNTYTRYKYQQIYLKTKRKTKGNHDAGLSFRIVLNERDKIKRDSDEISIAISNKAVFWSPNKEQSKIINEKLKAEQLS